MATPLQRACHQAARSASQCSRHSAGRQFAADGLRQQHARRPYSQSRAALAESNQRQASRRQSRRAAPAREQAYADPLAEDDADEDVSAIEQLVSESDVSSTGHAELQQHRELREMVRLAAWEMPLLGSLSQPFQAPDTTQLPLRWRYTTYFGEAHPASRKVVVSFKVDDHLGGLDEKQQLTLKKLAGARYNPQEKVVKMSCESFETQAQNKRYLGDVVQRLIAEAKDPDADSFADVPLDVRHHKLKKVFRFPEEWRLDGEKRARLVEQRRTLLLEEGKRVEESRIVSGIAAIEAARQMNLAREEEPVMLEARQPLVKGKQGRKEMGQTRGAQR